MANWPREKNINENVLDWLDERNIEVCSPSELRDEYFRKKKENSVFFNVNSLVEQPKLPKSKKNSSQKKQTSKNGQQVSSVPKTPDRDCGCCLRLHMSDSCLMRKRQPKFQNQNFFET